MKYPVTHTDRVASEPYKQALSSCDTARAEASLSRAEASRAVTFDTLRKVIAPMRRTPSLLTAFVAVALAAGCTSSPASDAGAPADTSASDSPTADRMLTCTPGAQCGSDCLPQDAPCWACGGLSYDSQCRCRSGGGACAPATGCDNPSPAGEGEFCGTYFWCNRPCAAGLTCTGAASADSGLPPGLDYRRRCERPRDASVDDVPRD